MRKPPTYQVTGSPAEGIHNICITFEGFRIEALCGDSLANAIVDYNLCRISESELHTIMALYSIQHARLLFTKKGD